MIISSSEGIATHLKEGALLREFTVIKALKIHKVIELTVDGVVRDVEYSEKGSLGVATSKGAYVIGSLEQKVSGNFVSASHCCGKIVFVGPRRIAIYDISKGWQLVAEGINYDLLSVSAGSEGFLTCSTDQCMFFTYSGEKYWALDCFACLALAGSRKFWYAISYDNLLYIIDDEGETKVKHLGCHPVDITIRDDLLVVLCSQKVLLFSLEDRKIPILIREFPRSGRLVRLSPTHELLIAKEQEFEIVDVKGDLIYLGKTGYTITDVSWEEVLVVGHESGRVSIYTIDRESSEIAEPKELSLLNNEEKRILFECYWTSIENGYLEEIEDCLKAVKRAKNAEVFLDCIKHGQRPSKCLESNKNIKLEEIWKIEVEDVGEVTFGGEYLAISAKEGLIVRNGEVVTKIPCEGFYTSTSYCCNRFGFASSKGQVKIYTFDSLITLGIAKDELWGITLDKKGFVACSRYKCSYFDFQGVELWSVIAESYWGPARSRGHWYITAKNKLLIVNDDGKVINKIKFNEKVKAVSGNERFLALTTEKGFNVFSLENPEEPVILWSRRRFAKPRKAAFSPESKYLILPDRNTVKIFDLEGSLVYEKSYREPLEVVSVAWGGGGDSNCALAALLV